MSGRPCSACADVRRPGLDAAIVAGESFRAIARQFAPLSRDAIRRHRPHITTALVKAVEARQDAEAVTLLDKVRALEADAHRLKQKAEEDHDYRAALVAVDKLLDVVRLYGELTPTPTAAYVRAMAEKYASTADVPVEELLALAEKLAREVEGRG